uniref:Uncharacterized protein n=1 Tax=Eutreptiella gymnastica TaxID=73025 RepID=A0A7S1N4W4_9EUGL
MEGRFATAGPLAVGTAMRGWQYLGSAVQGRGGIPPESSLRCVLRYSKMAPSPLSRTGEVAGAMQCMVWPPSAPSKAGIVAQGYVQLVAMVDAQGLSWGAAAARMLGAVAKRHCVPGFG